MKRLIVLLAFLSFTRISGQVNTMKLLQFDQKDQIVTDGIQIGQSMFFAVSSVDTAMSGFFTYHRSSSIIKVDNNFNVIGIRKIGISSSLDFIHITRLFKIKHPVRNEPAIGFIGDVIDIDTLLNDTTSYIITGYISMDFNDISYDTFYVNAYTASSYVHVINDTTFLTLLQTLTNNRLIVRFTYDASGFYLWDSIKYGFGAELYQVSGNNMIYAIQMFNDGSLKYYSMNWLPNLSILPNSLQTLFVKNIQVDRANGLSLINYNDTLWAQVYLEKWTSNTTTYFYLYKFIENAGSLQIVDSNLINVSTYPSTYINVLEEIRPWHSTALRYPYLYSFSDNKFNDSWYCSCWWDFEWIHYSTNDSNFIRVYEFDARNLGLRKTAILGGDAFYLVNGILSPSDSVAVIYGWRFPLGDSLRNDGDAFIWKVDFSNYITTSLWGASPQNTLILYPNPTTNLLKIRSNEAIRPDIRLYTLDGKLLRKKTFPKAKEFTLHLSDLPQGTYLLEVLTSSGHKFTEKVVIK